MSDRNKEDLNFVSDEKTGLFGFNFSNYLIFFDYPLSRSLYLLKKTKLKVNQLANVLLLMGIIIGWLCFFLWTYLNWQLILLKPVTLFLFWQKPHPLILIFLLSLFLDLFYVYRKSLKKEALKKINYSLFSEKK